MKLLLDEQLSERIVQPLNSHYPDSAHVRMLRMGGAADEAIWNYAKRNGYAIVTMDSDFHAYGIMRPDPPLVIWLRLDNPARDVVLEKLLTHREMIEQANADPDQWLVEIP